jgi:catechol 1,2-dioxygenase
MATNDSNGTPPKFDPNFTKAVINATGPKASPRARKVMGSLIQHLHDFTRENEITVDEWMSAVDFVRPFSLALKNNS